MSTFGIDDSTFEVNGSTFGVNGPTAVAIGSTVGVTSFKVCLQDAAVSCERLCERIESSSYFRFGVSVIDRESMVSSAARQAVKI